ncbi:hypothetical protein D6D21_10733 [Aureobasidium pullulans]|uniref:Uncharacterized protein n=1 Tax=Aureobasidium pullulans TaxID=5580 RepID=A0A4S8WXF4_AURPU|nr:hypothetical protein D6D21_10733 [Aureobasidium pullulans]THW54767.1 hypothetical protein D6D20_09970 [Aureobasidium pullulans]
MTQGSTYSEPSANPATSGNFKISARDAVRRETLRYFSSNPGPDCVGPNTSLHSRARRCLSEEEVSLEELANLSSALLYRNAVTELAQKYLDVMVIAPALASQTDAYRMMREADLFFQDTAIGQPHNEPQMFVLHSLLAAGFLPGQGFEEKLKMAKSISGRESTLFLSLKERILKLRDSDETEGDCLNLLRQNCNMDQEFEFEKRVVRGKVDVQTYRNDCNEYAYDVLEAMELEPMWLFERFGTYEWALLVTTGGRSRQAQADKLLSVAQELMPPDSALHRKINKYIVVHAMELDVEAFKDKLVLIKAHAEEKLATARKLEIIDCIKGQDYKL